MTHALTHGVILILEQLMSWFGPGVKFYTMHTAHVLVPQLIVCDIKQFIMPPLTSYCFYPALMKIQ